MCQESSLEALTPLPYTLSIKKKEAGYEIPRNRIYVLDVAYGSVE